MLRQNLKHPERSVWGPNSFHKREVKRHSVEADVKKFCGWKTLNDIVEAARKIGTKGDRNAGFIAALFNTGGRVSEVLQLKPIMFKVYKGCQPRLVMVEDMPLLKRYEKTGSYTDPEGNLHYNTKQLTRTRDISMRADEPLIKPMLEWYLKRVDEMMKDGRVWLFPSPYTSDSLSRKWAYFLIYQIGEKLDMELYPHWFRAQRASQLASEYEFREASLMEWFQWEKWETAKKYAKLGPLGLAKRMGVKFRRSRGLKPHEIESLVEKKTYS